MSEGCSGIEVSRAPSNDHKPRPVWLCTPAGCFRSETEPQRALCWLGSELGDVPHTQPGVQPVQGPAPRRGSAKPRHRLCRECAEETAVGARAGHMCQHPESQGHPGPWCQQRGHGASSCAPVRPQYVPPLAAQDSQQGRVGCAVLVELWSCSHAACLLHTVAFELGCCGYAGGTAGGSRLP